jgi:hypothetical protein
MMRAHPSLKSFAVRLALTVALALPILARADWYSGTGTTAIPGVAIEQLEANYWIKRVPEPFAERMGKRQIVARSSRLRFDDKSYHDIAEYPDRLDSATVRAKIEAVSQLPENALYDEKGVALTPEMRKALLDSLALDAIPATQTTRYGMITRRASLRTFPTHRRVFRDAGDTDIDRFQETALFPGEPLVVVHTSRDDEWFFIVSSLYAAWVPRDVVAEGDKQKVYAYRVGMPSIIVTGPTARTVHSPEAPAVSDVQLEMGMRFPIDAEWPADKPVNGQHPYASYVIKLPVRDAQGKLDIAPALVPRSADVSRDYLPMDRRGILLQSFKFLGERYGWGHDYNARDCSGFVSEVYRSFGLIIPRNTKDQAVMSTLDRIELGPDADHAKRVAIVNALDVGDLIYIPGHVMMVIGHEHGTPYVIHDTTGISYRDAKGEIVRAKLNGVSVTPLAPLLLGDGRSYIDGITNIQRLRQ